MLAFESEPPLTAESLLRPDWPAPAGVCAAVSLRTGGVSAPPYASLNLGAHVGDDAPAVAQNRRRLREALQLACEPLWLTQVHGTEVVDADRLGGDEAVRSPPRADAAFTRQTDRVLAVLVADCLPVLFTRRDGRAIAIAHAGWRGLAAGVLESTLAALDCPGAMVQAWLGPAIGPDHFEVGDEVRRAFCCHDPQAVDAFVRNARGRWQCDLYRLALQRLQTLGVRSVYGRRLCSYSQAQSFYSFRRDGVTGRMAALIWLRRS